MGSQSNTPTMTTHKMTRPTHNKTKALQLNGSTDNSSCSLSAECQMMPVTIRRRLRSVVASPRWRLAMLICMMLYVSPSAALITVAECKMLKVTNAGVGEANGVYERCGKIKH